MSENTGLQILTLDAYQLAASETADYPQATDKEALNYLIMGLVGEAGELANKWKKYLRGDYELSPMEVEKLIEESGDCMWYISEISRQLWYSLSETANRNLNKLSHRKATGTIKGNGDGMRDKSTEQGE